MKAFFAWLLSLLSVFSFLTPAAKEARTAPQDVCLIGHQGYSVCYEGNTAESFRMAGEAGFAGAETDMRLTLDGKIVLSHGDQLEFADGSTMTVALHTFKELTEKPLKNEFTDTELYLCTFAEYLDICKAYDMICFVELKGLWPASKIIEAFRIAQERYDLSKCEFQSFELPNLLIAHLAFPELRIMMACTDDGFNARAALALGFDLDMRRDHLTQEIVERFHEKGLMVSCFTVNEQEEFNRCKACGVDFIETDALAPETIQSKGVSQ